MYYVLCTMYCVLCTVIITRHLTQSFRRGHRNTEQNWLPYVCYNQIPNSYF